MSAIFMEMLRRQRGQIVGWGVAIAALGALLLPIYNSFADMGETLGTFVEALPPAMFAALGMEDAMEFLTPAGFIGAEFFSYMPLVLGILAISLGSGLIATDEENGILDLLMAHPISRAELFGGRLLGLVAALAGVLGLAWGGLALSARLSDFAIGPAALALPFLSLFALLLFFATLALLFSLVLPARRLAAGAAGVVLVGAFFARTFADLDPAFERLGPLSPLSYYQSGDAISGLNLSWFGGLLALSALFALLALWRFQRRDLRVGGEGSVALRRRVWRRA